MSEAEVKTRRARVTMPVPVDAGKWGFNGQEDVFSARIVVETDEDGGISGFGTSVEGAVNNLFQSIWEDYANAPEWGYGYYRSISQVRHLPAILGLPGVAREKIHGMNVGFGFFDDRDIIRGRNEVFAEGKNANLSKGWYGYAVANRLCAKAREIFPESTDVLVFGEWYGPGIHKGVDYGPNKDFACIDIFINGKPMDEDRLEEYAAKLGVELAPVVFEGVLTEGILGSIATFDSLLAARNGAQCRAEGVVFRTRVPLYDNRGVRLIVKIKDGEFEERAFKTRAPHVVTDEEQADREFAEWFAEEYVVKMRLVHVLEKLEQAGKDVHSIQTMRDVINAMGRDAIQEADAEHLAKLDMKVAGPAIANRTRELFKAHLENPVI